MDEIERKEKLRALAAEEERKRAATPKPHAPEPKKRQEGRGFLLAAGCLLAVAAVVLLIAGFGFLKGTEEETSVSALHEHEEDSILTVTGSAKIRENITISSVAEETDPEIINTYGAGVITVTLPAAVTGISSQDEADTRAEAYRFYYGRLNSDGTASYSMSKDRYESVLKTFLTELESQTAETEALNWTESISFSNDLMRTEIIIKENAEPSDNEIMQAASRLFDLIEPYAYFSGLCYVRPTIQFFDSDGNLVKTVVLENATERV